MEPNLGWTLLSRDALRRAETQLRDDVQGVRDEIGFLSLHQAYADRFFPGTSVLHTRLRYALFVPWIYTSLIEKGVRERFAEAVEEAEINLVGQLRLSDETGIIGKENFPKSTTQPPCLVYWSSLGSWGILRPLQDGTYPARSVIHRKIGKLSRAGKFHDDDKQLLQEDEPLFVSLPPPPKTWGKKSTNLDFRLLGRERRFLRNLLIGIRRPFSTERSLMSRLVESNIELGAKTEMWTDDVFYAADDLDRAAMKRAQQAASLSAIGRGIYSALVEDMRENYDGVPSGHVHLDALENLVGEYGNEGLRLDVSEIKTDAEGIDGKILEVLERTQKWVRAGARNVSDLYQVYCEAEAKRKTKRARLPKTLIAREKRLEWIPEKHPAARPLHYRWDVARGFLMDLSSPRGSDDNE